MTLLILDPLTTTSQLYYTVGQFDIAMDYADEALDLSDKEGDTYGRSRCLNTKGIISCFLNKYDEAYELLNEALTLSRYD